MKLFITIEVEEKDLAKTDEDTKDLKLKINNIIWDSYIQMIGGIPTSLRITNMPRRK